MSRSIGNIKNLNNGKYILRISAGFDDYGNRIQPSKTVEAKSDTDAERQLMKFYNEKSKLVQDRVSKAPTTLLELYEEFKQNHIEKLRPNTQDFYINIWNRYLKPYGKSKLRSFSPKMVYEILNKSGVGDRTKKAIYGMLFTMFKKSVGWGYIDKNPCDNVEPPKYKAKEKRPYTESELEMVIEAISTQELKLQLIFYCAAMCGMRRSEIVGLKWNDIDFKLETISINKAAARSVGNGTYVGETKNSRSARTLNLPPSLAIIFKSYRAEQVQKKLKLGNKWIGSPFNENWIFTQWNGNIMSIDTPTEMWTKFLTSNTNLPKTNLHALRHTAATLLIKNNIDVATVSGILGHSQISTTLNIYAHIIEDAKKEAMHTMENIFNTKKA